MEKGHRKGTVGEAQAKAGSSDKPCNRRGEEAIQELQEAAGLDTLARLSPGNKIVYGLEATRARMRAERLRQPEAPVRVSAGEAVTWENQGASDKSLYKGAHARIVDTLEHPDSISVGASARRMSAALDADVLEPAVDAATSAQAANSIEKMLCHQMAAAHLMAMRLCKVGADAIVQSTNPYRGRLPPGEVARLTNAAARMMDVYQAGCLALLKLQTRGTQRVLVQHQQVNVGPGGQAVVTGRIDRGSRGRGEEKNPDELHEK